MGMETGYSLSDIKAVTDGKGTEGGMGGSWMWIIVLFLFMFGRNGFGGQGGDNTCASAGDVQRNFDTSTIINKLDGIGNGLCDGFYSQNTTMLQGFNGVDTALCNGFNSVNNSITQARFDAQQCC